jgi:hypothetical protein
MANVVNAGNDVFETSSTATTGGDIFLLGAQPGYRTFRQEHVNGAKVALELRTASGSQEYSYGTLVYGTPDKITSRVIYGSGLAGGAFALGVPIAWGAGTRDALCAMPGQAFLYGPNNLSDLASPSTARASLGLGTSAVLDVGATASKIPQLDGSALLPLSTIPPHTHTSLVASFTGGSANKVVRFASAGAVANAAKTDTRAQLANLMIRGSDGVLYHRGLVPFTGVAAGTVYYLGTGGDLTTSPPAIDGLDTRVMVGMGWNTNVLYFNPQPLIAGGDGFIDATPVYHKNGYFQSEP